MYFLGDGLGSRIQLRQFVPEKFAAVEDLPGAHVEQIDRKHFVFEVVAEDVGVIAFDGGNALLFL